MADRPLIAWLTYPVLVVAAFGLTLAVSQSDTKRPFPVPAAHPPEVTNQTAEENACPPGQVPAMAQALTAISQATAARSGHEETLARLGVDPTRVTALDKLALQDAGAQALKGALDRAVSGRVFAAGCLKRDPVMFTRIEVRFALESSRDRGSARLTSAMVQKGEPVSAAALECIQTQLIQLELVASSGERFANYSGEAVQYVVWGPAPRLPQN